MPDAAALQAWAPRAAAAIARAIGGGGFDVVLSACALSQLCHPFQNAWALFSLACGSRMKAALAASLLKQYSLLVCGEIQTTLQLVGSLLPSAALIAQWPSNSGS